MNQLTAPQGLAAGMTALALLLLVIGKRLGQRPRGIPDVEAEKARRINGMLREERARRFRDQSRINDERLLRTVRGKIG